MIWGLPVEQYDGLAVHVRPMIEKMSERSSGRWTAETLEWDLLSRDRQAWVVGRFQALCLTHVGPEHVGIDGCVGEGVNDWWDDLHAKIKEWAQSLGKKRIIVLARPGWYKFGKQLGYKQTHIEAVLEL